MKKTILLLFIAFTSITLGQYRRLKVDKLILPQHKNASFLGTDHRGRLKVVDASNGVDISTKLDKGTYNGTASDLKNDIVKISNGVNTNINTLTNKLNNIPIYQAGNNIVIDNSNPLEPVINSTNISSGSNTTNLSYIAHSNKGIIENSNGDSATIPLANFNAAGLMPKGHFQNGISYNVNASINYLTRYDENDNQIYNINKWSVNGAGGYFARNLHSLINEVVVDFDVPKFVVGEQLEFILKIDISDRFNKKDNGYPYGFGNRFFVPSIRWNYNNVASNDPNVVTDLISLNYNIIGVTKDFIKIKIVFSYDSTQKDGFRTISSFPLYISWIE